MKETIGYILVILPAIGLAFLYLKIGIEIVQQGELGWFIVWLSFSSLFIGMALLS